MVLQSRAAYHGDKMLTLFTWGYWGWGTSTRELAWAVDAAEKKSGFEPPIFVDVRLRRSVCAPGFSGNAFAHVVGASRYQWMPRLGNRRIALGESGVQIDDPSAARDLMQLAIECARRFGVCPDHKDRRRHGSPPSNLYRRPRRELSAIPVRRRSSPNIAMAHLPQHDRP